ncbi:MAG TPA: iron-containing alcohol dehydrogenase family protein [Xanthobacteraceae bacterium]
MTPVAFGDWPGRVVFGAGAVDRLGAEASSLGARRALVICGSTVARGPMLAKVRAALGDALAGIFSEVTAHTPLEMVERGAKRVCETNADLLVTVGGGSAIDAGKAIAILLASAGDVARYGIRYTPGGEMVRSPLPDGMIQHIAVPTTAGSASEVMPTAGCRDPISRSKLLFWDRRLVPRVTILDPEMAIYSDAGLTAATGMTAVARCVESLYSGKRQPLSTGLALHALRLLSAALPRSIASPTNLAARADCQIGALMSGVAAINAMVSLVHAIGHVIGGRYALQHGIAHAILLAPAMRLLLPVLGDQEALLTDALTKGTGACEGADSGAAGIMAGFVRRLPLPQRLRDVGVRNDELADIAHSAVSDYMMANLPRPLSERDVLALLQEGW